MSADSTKISDEAKGHVSEAPDHKLCIDVVAQLWSKDHNQTVETYKNSYRQWLNKQDASQDDLNNAWENHLVGVDAAEEGKSAAQAMLRKMQDHQDCK